MQSNGVKGKVPCVSECFIQSLFYSLQLRRVLPDKFPVALILLFASKLWEVKRKREEEGNTQSWYCSTVECSERHLSQATVLVYSTLEPPQLSVYSCFSLIYGSDIFSNSTHTRSIKGYVAVTGGNQTLFCCIFWARHRTVAQDFC